MEPSLVVALLLGLTTLVATVAFARRGQALDRLSATIDRLRNEMADRQVAVAELTADDQALREGLDVGVIRIDPAQRIVEANARAHALLAHPHGNLAGRSLMEAFMDPSVEGLAARATMTRTGAARAEIRPAGADGPVIVVHAQAAPGGGIWLVLEDVSELRRLQRIRTEFIDNLSHELRTPLTTVSLLAETLQREAEGVGDAIPAKMRERIAKIEVETGHLVQMVNELLDLSRIEGGGTLQMADGVDMSRLAADSA